MKPGYRQDAATGQQLQRLRRDANGWLHFEARAARTGVTSYVDIDGTRELTTPEVLFEAESMRSIVGVPITDQHPPEILLDGQTAKRRQLGSVYSVRRDGDYLVVGGVITDAALAAKVATGEQAEVSPGYRRGVAKKLGTWTDGERFDSLQLDRLYNHLSIVPVGRCSRTCGGGECSCAVNLDAQGAATMGKKKSVRLDGQMFSISSDTLKKLIAEKSPEEQAAFWMDLALQASGEEDVEEEPAAAPGLAGPPPAASAPMRSDGAALASLQARLDASEARAAAAEKAAERRAKEAAEAAGKNIGEHLAALDRARLVFGARFDAAGRGPVEIDQATLLELYPEDKAEIGKYSPIEVQAHIRQAFHETRGDARVRGARQNRSDGFAPVAPGASGGRGDLTKELEEERRFNGHKAS